MRPARGQKNVGKLGQNKNLQNLKDKKVEGRFLHEGVYEI